MGGSTGVVAIDMHAHTIVTEAADLVAPYFTPESDEFIRWGGERSTAYNNSLDYLAPMLTDPDLRIKEMDRMRVDYQAVAIAPPHYFYWTEPDLGAKVASIQNDGIARFVDTHPERLVGLATLPMHNPEAAVSELKRAVTELGLKGASINPSAQGVDYDDARYEPFWDLAHDLDVVIVLHPNGFIDGRRLQDYYMINVVGNPLESTVALTKIVMGGVIERHPGIKIVAVHGGGYLPFYMDRMDHAAAERPDVGYKISGKPSDHLRQIYFDSIVFGDGLDYLVDRVGSDHIVLGTDYPYDMGEKNPVDRIARVAGISDEARAQMTGLTAARLLGLDT